MYSRGGASSGYGGQKPQQQQQPPPYSSESVYSHDLGPPYAVGGPEGSSQLTMASRHSSMLGGSKESDLQGYRDGGHYGGQYSSVYGSTGLSTTQQVSGMSGKGPIAPALEGRTSYGSAVPDSPKFKSGDYVSSSSLGYGQKSDMLFSDKTSNYPSMDMRQYGERHNAYAGRDSQDIPASRYGDSIGYGRPHQADIYNHMDQSSLLRQEILKTQLLQSASLDGVSRQGEYLATRGPIAHHATQDLVGYGGRTDVESRSLSYGSQHAPSILGAAPPQRTANDLIYSSSNPGYGVNLPPGRDYASGKGLHGASLDSDFSSNLLADRVAYARELDRREEERRRELLHDREKERERDKAREMERERDREREREREREHERERERARKREREREKERREKDREREHARGTEARRERSLSRISKDRGERGGSLLPKDSKFARKDSHRREVSHRRSSPVREKRREYVCKVYTSSLVEFERDYLSLDKRYPRLFVSPQCSKVVVRWPRENLRLPIHTPVSFEHSFIGEDAGAEDKGHPNIPEKSESRTIVWNAKMILMSGLSQNALEELSSNRSYADRIPHYCNMLRFAVLKRENAFMAIGGPWDIVDGGDPSVDNSSLVQTVIRYAKGIAQLGLEKCRNWNPFLEIHYDRIGKDGLFSHKEVTVLFVPDLSDCLPSLEAWRDQWLAHKKAIAERESQLVRKKDKLKEKKGGNADKETESHKKEKGDVKGGKKVESVSTGEATTEISKAQKDDNEQKAKAAEVVQAEKPDATKASEDVHNKEAGGSASTGKTVKKKIIKKIVKQKVGTENNQVSENPATLSDKTEVTAPPLDESLAASGDAVKTSARKKVVKKITAAKKESSSTPQKDAETGTEGSKEDPGGATTSVQDATVRKVVKKKIIKKVLKKKAASGGDETKDGDKGVKTVVTGGTEAEVPAAKLEENKSPLKSVTPEKKSGSTAITQSKADKEGKVDKKTSNEKTGKVEKPKEKAKLKDEVRKDQKEKDESKTKVKKEVRENKKSEEPPRHPGLFLQTKGGKDSKLHSVSLSLDSLLGYTDKDTDESTFEISLFAETLQEMLQYEMGCRLLTFLQKLRLKFVMKRNQRKRQREEEAKEREKKSPTKRMKTDHANVEDKSTKTEKDEAPCADDEKDIVKEEANNSAGTETVKQKDDSENVKQEDETTDDDPEEDPEEDEDEDEEMVDGSPQQESGNDGNDAEKKIESDVKVKMEVENSDDKKQHTAKENEDTKPMTGSAKKENEDKVEKKKKEETVVDKELLAAFRFFDRNRVGYIKVEDMRLIVHNLGKFISHRDVKELVQSALLESNTGRDDRIFYPELVRMTDI